MGLQAPEGLLAIHTNMPATVPADVDKALQADDPPPSGLSADERRAYEQLVRTFKQVDYARFMASKGGFFNAKGVSTPVAVSVFPGEQYQAPRSWTERAYPNLIHFNQVRHRRPLRRLGAAAALL